LDPGDNGPVEIDRILAAANAFGMSPTPESVRPCRRGLIHASWIVREGARTCLLQRLNRSVFPRPELVAECAAAAARRVDDALRRLGDRSPRHRLVFLDTPGGRPWHRDARHEVWRVSVWIERSRPPEATCLDEVHHAAAALGRFPALVAAGEGPEPVVTLPGFHDTARRLAELRDAVAADCVGRVASSRPECERLLGMEAVCRRLEIEGIPYRFIHNDAKLDNVLVDEATGTALCVVDLDTVMPGPAAHDFGDLVRTTISGGAEDEPDQRRIVLRQDIFRAVAGGYLDGAGGWLTSEERASLVDGAVVITCEQAIRFLTDYLRGDRYYRVEDPQHNLRRARAQLRLLDELLAHEDDLRLILAGP
jgi:hypothetical protein